MTMRVIQWLLASQEPWTRYRTLVDLLGRPQDDAEVKRRARRHAGTSAGQAVDGRRGRPGATRR